MIDLNIILAHLPKNKIADLETLTQRIVATSMAEFVLLYGSYARGNYKENRGAISGKRSDYDILVISADDHSKQLLEAELRGLFSDFDVPVQWIVEHIDFVNSNLEEKQYFFSDIKKEGKLLYTSGKFKLSEPKVLGLAERKKIAADDFKNWFGQAKSFHRSANHDINDGEFRIASFHFQQVVEMCYTTIEMVFTHYNPHEHDLKVLRERVVRFEDGLKNVLPYKSKEEQKLFDHLNFAYIGGRYRSEEEFSVTKTQLDYWAKEVDKLLELTESACQKHITGLTQ